MKLKKRILLILALCLTFASLFAVMAFNSSAAEGDVTVTIDGGGPIGRIVCVADKESVRGCVDVPKLEKLVAAMTTMECGIPYGEVDREAIRQGFDLAFPGKRSLARTQPAPDTFSLDTLEDLLMWDEYRDW